MFYTRQGTADMKNIMIKDHVREICNQKNMTLTELAEKIGMSRQQFYRAVRNYRLDNVCQILAELDCKFEDAFEIIILNDVK